MTTDPLEDHVGEGRDATTSSSGDAAPVDDDFFPDPTAGMVLHRVLATAARTFLLNDMGEELAHERSRTDTVDAFTLAMGTRPLWAESAVGSMTKSTSADARYMP